MNELYANRYHKITDDMHTTIKKIFLVVEEYVVIHLLNGIDGSTRRNSLVYLADAICKYFSVLGLYDGFDWRS